MTDANGQVLPDMGPYPVLLADHRLPLPQQNIPHRPLLPPIDTDLDDLPLQSFDTSYTSSSSHSDSALFHSFSGPPAIQSASQHVFSPHLSNSPSSAPARFNPIPERLTRQLPDVPPRSPAYVPSSTLQNSPTIPSKQMLLAEFQAGQINSRANAAGSWELECPRCSTWINANIDSNRPLMIEGHFTPLHNHMKGGDCGANKSRSISRSPSLTRHPSVASLSSHHSPSSSTSSPNLSRGLSVPPSPSPYSPRVVPPQFPSTASSFTFSSTSSPTLPRGQSVPPLPFSPRSGPSPLPSADMPLPFASFSHDTRYNHQR